MTQKVFFSLMEMVKFNAFKLYLASTNHPSNLTFLQFSSLIVKGLIAGYSTTVRRGRPSIAAPELRLTQRHMPSTFEKKSRCHLCYMRNRNGRQDNVKQTKYGCHQCAKHLCLPECFSIYHTERNCY